MPNLIPSAEFDDLTATVQQNCHVSDAFYAGNYTMCVFLLKMREYYRWEQGIALTAELNRESVGDWLVERERSWDEIENEKFETLPASGGARIDAFDADTVNGQLLSSKFVYSSGKGLYSKPHFFIGDLENRTRSGISRYWCRVTSMPVTS